MSAELIYQRGSMLYTDVEVGGKRVRRSTGFKVGQEAQARLVAARIAAGVAPAPDKGQPLDHAGMTVAQAVARATRTRWRDNKSQRYLLSQSTVLIRNMGGDTLIRDIDQKRYDAYIRAAEDEGIMPSTLNGRIAFLRTLLAEAVEWGVIDSMPKMPRRKQRATQRHYLSVEEASKVIACETTPHYKSLWTFLLHTGCRIGEALKLTPSQIVGGVVQLVDTKNGKNRAVPLTPQALQACTEPGEVPRARYGYSASGLEAKVEAGRIWPMSYRGYLVAWNQAVMRAGVKLAKGTGIHITRHSAATQLLAQGADIREVQEWLGHANITQTAVYAKVMPARLNRLRDLLGDALGETAAERVPEGPKG